MALLKKKTLTKGMVSSAAGIGNNSAAGGPNDLQSSNPNLNPHGLKKKGTFKILNSC